MDAAQLESPTPKRTCRRDAQRGVKYYAVRVGRVPGVYLTWPDARAQVVGYAGAVYRKFDARAAAEAFSGVDGVAPAPAPPIVVLFASDAATVARNPEIYVDGSCLGNGRGGARAGVGVFFGDGDPRNLSESFTMDNPTNQRAEILAIVRALEVCLADPRLIEAETITVRTDSMYVVNCVQRYIDSWRAHAWHKSDGEPVKNRDLIERLGELRDRLGPRLSVHHVKGHAGNRGNDEADRLAKRGSEASARVNTSGATDARETTE